MKATVPWLLLLVGGCSAAPAAPVPAPDPPAPATVTPAPAQPPAAIAVPAKIRAALVSAAPKEAAIVALPEADAQSIALVRTLDANLRAALADLERDGGRHMTPAAISRANTALRDLQNHLREQLPDLPK